MYLVLVPPTASRTFTTFGVDGKYKDPDIRYVPDSGTVNASAVLFPVLPAFDQAEFVSLVVVLKGISSVLAVITSLSFPAA